MIDLRDDPQAIRVVKRPIPVMVEFATEEGICQTLEGPVAYRAGDALLTGVVGERWPVARQRFDLSYTPLPPLAAGRDGTYLKRHGVVLARRLETPLRLGLARGVLRGEPGDWLLQYAPGDLGIVRSDIFSASYDRV
ncbi:MAG: PGDYG domain-containing protein [Gammaproteobacteria bacterium]